MRKLPKDFPRSESSILIGKAVKRLKKMSLFEKIDLMVHARLMTKEEAEAAKQRLITEENTNNGQSN